MPIKDLKSRVEDSLETNETKEYVDEYHKALMENIHRTDEKFHRSILLLLLSATIFELLAHTLIAEASVGPFKLNNLPLLQKYILVLAAYSYCSICCLGAMRKYMRDLSSHILGINHRSVCENNLDLFLEPSSLLHTAETVETFSQGVIAKTSGFIEQVFLVGVIFGPIVFFVYAFYQCFSLFGFADVNVWVSLILSFILVLQAMVVFIHYLRDM